MSSVATVFEHSCKPYTGCFKLNSLQPAVMHVTATRHPRQLADSGIVWSGMSVPVVSQYCQVGYLGLCFNHACN
jgi:hypothetical protein